MDNKNVQTNIIAAKATASVFGILAGLGGLIHGIGEILQGNVAPDGFWIYSWTQGPIATNMGGEPGITIVPNLLVTGILTIIVSLILIIWSLVYVQRKHGGDFIILLSVIMLLVGGGIGPPVIGILAGVAGKGIKAPLTWWRKNLSSSLCRFLSKLWPLIYGIAVINGVFLVIGSVILVYFFDMNNPDVFTNSFFFAVLTLLLLIPTGRVYDIHKNEDVKNG